MPKIAYIMPKISICLFMLLMTPVNTQATTHRPQPEVSSTNQSPRHSQPLTHPKLLTNKTKRMLVAQGDAQNPHDDTGKAEDAAKIKKPDPPVVKETPKPEPEFRRYGIALRGGMLFFPEFLLNSTFFDESEGVINADFGIAFVLRTSPTFEYVFGISYNLFNFYDQRDRDGKPIPHVFLSKGDETYKREFINNSISYLSIDVRFQKLFPLHPHFQILLGGGVGLGIVFGNIMRTDTYIPDYQPSKEEQYRQNYKTWKADPYNQRAVLDNQPCVNASSGRECDLHQGLSDDQRKESRVPPIVPVFHFVVGLVFPIVIDRWDIRIQGGVGLPSFFWYGLSTHINF